MLPKKTKARTTLTVAFTLIGDQMEHFNLRYKCHAREAKCYIKTVRLQFHCDFEKFSHHLKHHN